MNFNFLIQIVRKKIPVKVTSIRKNTIPIIIIGKIIETRVAESFCKLTFSLEKTFLGDPSLRTITKSFSSSLV